jgi:hypothetical protein
MSFARHLPIGRGGLWTTPVEIETSPVEQRIGDALLT